MGFNAGADENPRLTTTSSGNNAGGTNTAITIAKAS